MRQASDWVTHSIQAGALLLLAGLSGCRGGGGPIGLPMPKDIIDLSPVITPDLPVRQFGHRACEFLGLKERVAFTPVAPSKEAYTFGLSYFELASNLGAH